KSKKMKSKKKKLSKKLKKKAKSAAKFAYAKAQESGVLDEMEIMAKDSMNRRPSPKAQRGPARGPVRSPRRGAMPMTSRSF
ncbi:MAG: hypothetical protein ACO32Q_08525, partial [Burkholderiaceae bacterium]